MLHLVALAWMYVVLMVALAEAFSPQGTLLGALFTVLGWGDRKSTRLNSSHRP